MTLQGIVYDTTTNRAIPYATVFVTKNGNATGESTNTDLSGHYTISISDPANSELMVSAIGYGEWGAQLTENGNIYIAPDSAIAPPTVKAVPITSVKVPTQINPTGTIQNNSMDYLPTQAPGPTWAELKPLLIGVAIVFVVGYIIATQKEK